jgi:hypothetical protein
MAKHGEIDMPDCAIFADVAAEPKSVYDYLDFLQKELPFPIHRVKHEGGLLQNLQRSVRGERAASVPFFTKMEGPPSMLRRQCTQEFKILPIRNKLRELLGAKKGERLAHRGILVRQYIGISLDEAIRMKPNRDKWIINEWPLIDKRMTRHDCKRWLEKHGYPEPPKSACTFCPYHSNAEWRRLRDTEPEAWQQALEVDAMVRDGTKGATQKLFLHRSCVPLDQVDLRTDADIGQLDLWGNECEGMCGL